MAMFPEGTRRAKGLHKKHEPRPHTGAARIGSPRVSRSFLQRLRGALTGLSRLGPMRLQFGAQIRLDDLRELDSQVAAEEANQASSLDGDPEARGRARRRGMRPPRQAQSLARVQKANA